MKDRLAIWFLTLFAIGICAILRVVIIKMVVPSNTTPINIYIVDSNGAQPKAFDKLRFDSGLTRVVELESISVLEEIEAEKKSSHGNINGSSEIDVDSGVCNSNYFVSNDIGYYLSHKADAVQVAISPIRAIMHVNTMKNSSRNSYQKFEVQSILLGLASDKTWKDINLKSKAPIRIAIPSDYNKANTIMSLYSTLEYNSQSTFEEIKATMDIILAKAEFYDPSLIDNILKENVLYFLPSTYYETFPNFHEVLYSGAFIDRVYAYNIGPKQTSIGQDRIPKDLLKKLKYQCSRYSPNFQESFSVDEASGYMPMSALDPNLIEKIYKAYDL